MTPVFRGLLLWGLRLQSHLSFLWSCLLNFCPCRSTHSALHPVEQAKVMSWDEMPAWLPSPLAVCPALARVTLLEADKINGRLMSIPVLRSTDHLSRQLPVRASKTNICTALKSPLFLFFGSSRPRIIPFIAPLRSVFSTLCHRLHLSLHLLLFAKIWPSPMSLFHFSLFFPFWCIYAAVEPLLLPD